MTSKRVCKTLQTIASFEDVIGSVAAEELDVKKTCIISANSITAWGIVMNEFNDVITTLAGAEAEEDRIYRAAFCKALEIVMLANKYKTEASYGNKRLKGA